MIDLKAARAEPDTWRAALARKGAGEAFDALLAADERWRAARTPRRRPAQQDEAEGEADARAARGAAGGEGGAPHSRGTSSPPPRPPATRRSRTSPTRRTSPPPTATPRTTPSRSAASASNPTLTEVKEASEVGRFELERASRLSGSRFGYIVGDTALLALALYRFALDHVGAAGFTPVLPPVLVREEAMIGTGFFPTEKSNIYELEQDGLFLTGTSEVALAAHAHVGDPRGRASCRSATPGSRRASGAKRARPARTRAGCSACTSSTRSRCSSSRRPTTHGPSTIEWWRSRRSCSPQLGLPYRVVNVAAGDLGAPAAKKIDIEAWFPSQERYREVTSCSNTTDFQARRLGIRFRSENGLETPHTLNGTVVTDRAAPRDPGELPGRGAGRASCLRRSRPHRALNRGFYA